MDHTWPLFRYFRTLQTNNIICTANVKNVHPVSGAGIRTHDLLNTSCLPKPLDQWPPRKFVFAVLGPSARPGRNRLKEAWRVHFDLLQSLPPRAAASRSKTAKNCQMTFTQSLIFYFRVSILGLPSLYFFGINSPSFVIWLISSYLCIWLSKMCCV